MRFITTVGLVVAFVAGSCALSNAADACAFYRIGGPNEQGLCLYYAMYCSPASGPATALFACNANTSGCGNPMASCITGLGGSGRLRSKAVAREIEPGYEGPRGATGPADVSVEFELMPNTGDPDLNHVTVDGPWLVKFNDKPGTAGERFAKIVRVNIPAQMVNGEMVDANSSVFGWQIKEDTGKGYLPAEMIRRTKAGMNRARVAVEIADGQAVIAEVIMHRSHVPNPLVASQQPGAKTEVTSEKTSK